MSSSKTVTVLFAEGTKIGSLLIRFVTWSRFSHVGVLTLDGKYVYEAAAGHGVVLTPVDDFIGRYKSVERVKFYCKDPHKAFKWAQSQLGKPYDWGGAFSFLVRRDWGDDKKWYCSEYVARILEEGQTPYYRSGINGVDPEDLWKINPLLPLIH